MYSELLIGCGHRRKKFFTLNNDDLNFKNLTTIDINPDCNPDFVHDLNVYPWPVEDNAFDEVHAIEVLEHLGTQGDFKAFFKCFEEIYRVLKPGGKLYASSPSEGSIWLWGDPGHTRVISPASLVFLSQAEYEAQIGKTPMSDYRHWYKGDLRPYKDNNIAVLDDDGQTFRFVLYAHK